MTTEIRVSDIELILAETALVRAGDLAAEGGGLRLVLLQIGALSRVWHSTSCQRC